MCVQEESAGFRFWWDLQLEDESVCHLSGDGYLSVYPLAFDDYLSVDVLVFPSAVCAGCGMSHPLSSPFLPLPSQKFLPKTICSSDYGGGSHTGCWLLFALLIVRILPATSGERGRSRYLAYLVPTFNLLFVAPDIYLIFSPRGSLSIRLRRGGSTSALNPDCGRFKGNGSNTIFQRGILGDLDICPNILSCLI